MDHCSKSAIELEFPQVIEVHAGLLHMVGHQNYSQFDKRQVSHCDLSLLTVCTSFCFKLLVSPSGVAVVVQLVWPWLYCLWGRMIMLGL